MADAKTPTYSVVTTVDIMKAMKSSGLSSVAGRKVAKNDGVVWDQTVIAIMDRVVLSEIKRDPTKDGIQAIGKQLKVIMAQHIEASMTIPLVGVNRKGETNWTIKGKDGTPQWSSWDETRRIWAYIGDVAKVLAFSQEAVLYPEANKVMARCDVLANCKIAEAPMKAVERLSAALQDNLDLMNDPTDVLTAHNLTANLTVNNLGPVAEIQMLLKKIDACLAGCTQDDLDLLAPTVAALAPHFIK